MEYLKYIWIPIFSFLFSFWWLKLFKFLKILDNPWPDTKRNYRVPTIQWLFLILWFLLCILIFFPNYFLINKFLAFVAWFILLGIISICDNYFDINPKIRLLVQIISVAIIFFFWWIWFNEFIIQWDNKIVFPIRLWFIFTIIWFLWFVNSINWFDWINWLASWVSCIWFLTIFLLLKIIVMNNFELTWDDLFLLKMSINLSFILFVLSLIYSFIEFKPLWLLRDVWTMFFGFSLAYLSLLWWAKIWIMLVVLSLVIFDAIWVFVSRVKKRINPLKWDYTHLHYRLMSLSWSKTEVRIFIRWRSLFLMILMILQWINRFNKMIIFIMMFIIFFGLNIYIFWIKKLPDEYKIKKI